MKLNNNDLVSVVIPVYEVDNYVVKCINSLLNQTYTNFEILLIDDGSSDKCPNICDLYSKVDSRIIVVHKENGGLSDARNYGIDLSFGDYISFVDSDDYVDDKYLELLLKAIKKTNSDISCCDVRFVYDETINKENNIYDVNYRIDSGKEVYNDILNNKGYRAVAWNKMYKKHIFEALRFIKGKKHEDEFLVNSILFNDYRYVFINCPLYNYLQREGSIIHRNDFQNIDDLESQLERINSLKDKYPSENLKDKIIFCKHYKERYKESTKINDSITIEKLKSMRKTLTFTINEIRDMSLKDKMYVLGTKSNLIKVFNKLV